MKVAAWLLLLFASVCPFTACAQSQDKALRLALLLFPDAANLRTVGTMQRLTNVEMTPAFIPGLMARLPPHSLMAQVCGDPPFSDATPSSFTHISLNGQQGIIYEGPISCAEGDATVIWPVPGPVSAPDALQVQGDLLLIGDGPQPFYVDYIPGCCADPDSRYVYASSFDPFPESFTVREDLALPDGMSNFGYIGNVMIRPKTFVKSAFTLRNAPMVDDTQSPDVRSPELRFGNILKRYAAGTWVTGLANWTDKKGLVWVLVSVPDDPAQQKPGFIEQSYDLANVGWVAAGPEVF